MYKQLGKFFGLFGCLALAGGCGVSGDPVESGQQQQTVTPSLSGTNADGGSGGAQGDAGGTPMPTSACGPCPAGTATVAGYCWVVNMGEPNASATCARAGLTGSNGFVSGLTWTPQILANVSAQLGCINGGDTGCCAQSMWYQTSTNTCFTDNFSADVGGQDFFNWSGQRLPGQFAVDACNCPPVIVPQTKDDCKNDGWRGVTRADGTPFKNQGDCIQYVNTGK